MYTSSRRLWVVWKRAMFCWSLSLQTCRAILRGRTPSHHHQASDPRTTENAPRPAVPRTHVPCHYPMNGARSETNHRVGRRRLGHRSPAWLQSQQSGVPAPLPWTVRRYHVGYRVPVAASSSLLRTRAVAKRITKCHAVTGNDVYRRWCPQSRQTLFALIIWHSRSARRRLWQ